MTPEFCDALSGLLRFGAIGDDIAGANDPARGDLATGCLGNQRLKGAKVRIWAAKDQEWRTIVEHEHSVTFPETGRSLAVPALDDNHAQSRLRQTSS